MKLLFIVALAMFGLSPTFVSAKSSVNAISDGSLMYVMVGEDAVTVEMGGVGYSFKTDGTIKCPSNVVQTRFYYETDSDSAQIMHDTIMFALQTGSRVAISSDMSSAKVKCANEPLLIKEVKIAPSITKSFR